MSKREKHGNLRNKFNRAEYPVGTTDGDSVLHSFSIGVASTDNRDAVLALQHWHIDLIWLVAPVFLISAVCGWLLTMYGVVKVGRLIWYLWPVFLMEFGFAVTIWVCVLTRPIRQRTYIQEGLVYFFMAVAIFQWMCLLLWLISLAAIYDEHPIFWWLMFSVLAVTALNGINAMMALTNWTSSSKYCKAHANVLLSKMAAVEKHYNEQETYEQYPMGAEVSSAVGLLSSPDQFRPHSALFEFHSLLTHGRQGAH